MSMVQKGSSFSKLVRGLVGIPEVSTTSSLEELSRRILLSYPRGIWKAFRESETIQNFSKELVLSACEGMLSWTSLCWGEPSARLVGKGWEPFKYSRGIPCILCEWCGGSMLAEPNILRKKSMANYRNKQHSLIKSRNQTKQKKTSYFEVISWWWNPASWSQDKKGLG